MKLRLGGLGRLMLASAVLFGVSYLISWVAVFVFGWGFGEVTGNDAFISYLFLSAMLLGLPASVLLWAMEKTLQIKGAKND